MAELTRITGAAWPTSGTATTGTTGLATLTGTNLVHVGSTDVPEGSGANGYVQGDNGTGIVVGINSLATAQAASNKYGFYFWCRFNLVGDPAGEAVFDRWVDLNGNGIRVIATTYMKPNGVTLGFSKLSGTGDISGLDGLGFGAGPEILEYGRWFLVRAEMDFTTGAFYYRIFINNTLVGRFENGVTTGSNELAEAVTLDMEAANCTVQLCGPFVSYNDESEIVKPIQGLYLGENPQTAKIFGMSYGDTGRGVAWDPEYTGSTAATRVSYASGGVNPVRKFQRLAGVGTATFTSEALGALPFNETGWCTIAFPMMYLQGSSSSSIKIALRNAADDADVVSLTLDGNSINDDIGATEPFAMNRSSRYALLLHLSNANAVTATLINQTATATQYTWSAPLASWATAELGPIVITVTVDSTDTPEIDGCFIGPWCDLIGVDSIVSATANGLTPVYHTNNHVSAALPNRFWDVDTIPGNSPYPVSHIIVGRPGRTSTNFVNDCSSHLTYTRGVRLVRIDGGSINDVGSVNTSNSQSVLEAWKTQVKSQVESLVASGNRVLLTTMIRREQGTYTQVQNDHIDARNAWLAQFASSYQVSAGAQKLIEFADVSGAIASHVTMFTAGDDVHFNAAGDLLYATQLESTVGFGDSQVVSSRVVLPRKLLRRIERHGSDGVDSVGDLISGVSAGLVPARLKRIEDKID